LEVLAEIGNTAAPDAPWQGYRAYCRLRAAGLRQEALQTLDGFVAEAAGWPVAERFAFARWLAGKADFEWNPPLLPEPLVRNLLAQSAAEQAARDPADPEARMLLGFFGDAASPDAIAPLDHYRAAHALDPANPVVGEVLVRAVLKGVAYSQHELPFGYLGAPEEDVDLLDEALATATGTDWGGQHLALLEYRRERARGAMAGRGSGTKQG
jgi:hypothetical protein